MNDEVGVYDCSSPDKDRPTSLHDLDLEVDIGDVAWVPEAEREGVDRPDLDAEGGDDMKVETMLADCYDDPGLLVPEKDLT